MPTRKCVRPLAPVGANGRVDKNGHSRIRGVTQTDAHGQFGRPICVAPLEMPLVPLVLQTGTKDRSSWRASVAHVVDLLVLVCITIGLKGEVFSPDCAVSVARPGPLQTGTKAPYSTSGSGCGGYD
jgi:hypothetical protein